METQEVIVAPPPAPVVVYTEPVVDETGLDDVARLKPTNILLVQNTTRETKSARPGQLLDTLTEEVYDALTVVPLKVMRQRVLFPPGELDLDADPVCRSNDGVVPSQFAKAPQSRACKTCPHSQWISGKKPPCAEKMKLLMIIKDAGLPRTFNVGGKSLTTLKNVLQRIQEAIRMQQAKGGEPLHLYDFFFEIRSEKVTGKFSYFVARFDNVKRVATIGDFGPLFIEFVLNRKYQDAEEQAVQAEAKTDAAVSSVVEAEFVQEV